MNAAVSPQPLLTDAEREIILELLERERAELPAEIHHTRTAELRDQLKRRLETIEHLLARFEACAASPQ